MKRVFPVLMIIALLLAGCGESEKLKEGLEEARENWAAAQSISFTAAVTAELSGSVFECTLRCSRSGEETVVEVLAPEIIAGISARIGSEGAELEYDGLILALGDAVKGEVSPVNAMPTVLSALLEGHVTGIWRESEGEKALIAAECYVSDSEYVKLWLDENWIPVYSELVSGGKAVVKCTIEEFTEE